MGRRPRAVPIALVVGAIGLAVTLAVFAMNVLHAREVQADSLQAEGRTTAQELRHAFAEADGVLAGIAGLFAASDFVSAEEFEVFTDTVDLPPGAIGVGYVNSVSSGMIGGFVGAARMQHESYDAFGLDAQLQPVWLDPADEHQLLLYGVPEETFAPLLGLDLASLPEARAALSRARETGEVTATPFLGGFGGVDSDQFLLVVPVVQQYTRGYAVALLDTGILLTEATRGGYSAETVVALSDGVSSIVASSGETWSTSFSYGDRTWTVTVTTDFAPLGRGRVIMLVIGIVTSLGIALWARSAFDNRRLRVQARTAAARVEQTDRLLSAVSHEIRTPLTALVGFLSELEHRWGEFPEEERAEVLSFASVSAADLTDLMEDLLVRERMLAGVPVPVEAEAMWMAGEVRAVATVGSVTMEPGDCEVVADRVRLRRTMRRVLDAMSGAGMLPIRISVERGDGMGHLSVESAMTFEPCCQSTLFVLGGECPVHVGDSPLRIGLPLARFVARSMRGDLSYDPDGRCMVLSLPATAAASRSAQRALIESPVAASGA